MKPIFNYILTASLSLLLSLNVYSQSFGISAGMNISELNFNDSDNSSSFYGDFKSILGVNAGFHYDFKFSERAGMRLGLAYSSKGFAYDSEISFTSTIGGDIFSEYSRLESNARLNYIQLNPMFKYTIPVGEKNAFYFLVGPYIGVGVFGKLDQSQTYSYTDPTGTMNVNESNSEDIEFGQDGDGFDYLDFGVTPSIGFQLHSFFVEASYDIGINDIDTYNEDDFKAYNRTLSIKLGYLFEK